LMETQLCNRSKAQLSNGVTREFGKGSEENLEPFKLYCSFML